MSDEVLVEGHRDRDARQDSAISNMTDYEKDLMSDAGGRNHSEAERVHGVSQKAPQETSASATQESSSSDVLGPPPLPSSRFALLCITWVLPFPNQHLVLHADCSRLCLGLFLSMLDSSIVATSLYAIAQDFGGSMDNINWVALAYTLTYLGCAVLFSRISDVVGRRAAFVSAFVIFVAFSLGCGWAKSLNMLIGFRALQGIGGSGPL
jgi:hypothetical protein